MAKVFLDANIFIDLIEKRKTIDRKRLLTHALFLSPLSIHILTYLYKHKIPDERLVRIDKFIKLVPFNLGLTIKALGGPTVDFEDNVQLHSGIESECDLFLTNDKKLLDLGYFGIMRVADNIGEIEI